MPHPNTCARVFVSDGFVCQYCHRLVYLGAAIKLLDCEGVDLELWDAHGKKEPLRQSWATVDHLLPLNSGGTDCLHNLVTCCVLCNSKRGREEQSRPPCVRVDGWTGYAECFLALALKHAGRMSTEDRKWKKAMTWAGVQPNEGAVIKAIAELRQLKAGNTT